MSGRPKIFGHLLREIINTGKCVTCGTCVSVCPVDTVKMTDGLPKLTGICIACGMCYNNCPQVEFDAEILEKNVFGRTRTDEEKLTGIYTAAYAARSLQENIKGQDGGVVTAILVNFLRESGDAAVVANLDETKIWVPKPLVALNEEEVIKSAGTKYTPSSSVIGAGDAVKNFDKNNVAVVGTPCQIRGLQLLNQGNFREANIGDAVKLKVGLFCMETFAYDSFMEYLESNDVNAERVTKFEIKDGKFFANYEDKIAHEAKLKEVKKLVRPCCAQCQDFTAEFADISVGNVGSPNGWSTVLVRTEKGDLALKKAEDSGLIEVKPLDEFKPGMSLVSRLSRMKKREAAKAIKKEE
jgi:coenzyme F420 hydrogenase subunit beta